jgi:hypothetical protein
MSTWELVVSTFRTLVLEAFWTDRAVVVLVADLAMIDAAALLVVRVMLPAAVPVLRARLPLPPWRVVAELESV